MPLHAPIACHSSPEISTPASVTVFRDDSAAARTTDAGRVRLGGYAPPLAPRPSREELADRTRERQQARSTAVIPPPPPRPLNADTVERTWEVAPMGTWAPGTARHALLEKLWDEGHSTAEIGRRMHCTKNAVVGAVHRNHLPPRPSPIGPGARLGYNRVRSVPRLAHIPLPSLAELVGASPLPLPTRPSRQESAARAAERQTDRVLAEPPIKHIRTRRIFPAKPPASPAPVVHHPRAIAITQRAAAELPPPPAPVHVRQPVPTGSHHVCQWPIGEPGTPGFRFCEGVPKPPDEPNERPKPYCLSHCLIAYVGTGRWQSDNDRSLQRAIGAREGVPA